MVGIGSTQKKHVLKPNAFTASARGVLCALVNQIKRPVWFVEHVIGMYVQHTEFNSLCVMIASRHMKADACGLFFVK